MPNANYDNIAATTLKAYFTAGGKATDNIFKRRALLSYLKDKCKIDVQGGSSAVFPIEFLKNTTFQTYAGYDTLTPAVDEIVTAAEFAWKQAATFIPMSGMEEAKNSGDRAFIKLLKTKVENAENSTAEGFESMFFTGVGTENSGKGWIGIGTLVGDEADAVTTVGGISATTDTYWRSKVVRGADAALTLAGLSNIYNTVSYPSDGVDFEITTQALWEKYEGLLQPQQRFMSEKMAAAGFDNLMHKGSTVVWSDLTPAKHWYFLNSKHLKLAVLDGKWMDFRGFVEPYNVDAKYGLVLNYGTLGVNSRRHLGVIRNAI